MIVTFDTNNKKNTLVTENGLPINDKPEIGFFKKLLELAPETQKQTALMTQLNDNWKIFNAPVKTNKSKPR